MSKQRQRADKGTLKKVLRYLAPYRLLIGLSILLSAGSVALTLYVPIVLGQAIDLIVGEGQVDFAGVGRLLLRVALAVGATALMQWLTATINNRVSFQVVRDVRREAFDRLMILPLSYLDAHPVGEIVSRVIADVDQFSDGLLMGFTQLFTGVLTILGTLGFMLSIRRGHRAGGGPAHTAVACSWPASSRGTPTIMFKQQSETRGEPDRADRRDDRQPEGGQGLRPRRRARSPTSTRCNEQLADCSL